MNKKIILVGCGGLAREFLGYFEFEKENGNLKGFEIKGFIDDDIDKAQKSSKAMNLRYLGDIDSYSIDKNEYFWIAIGTNPSRKDIYTKLSQKDKNKFFGFVSSLAYISKSSKVDKSVTIAPFCIVNSGASIDENCIINSYAAIGHDSQLGANSILSPYAAINGSCKIESELFMGTRATIFPGIKVGRNCTVTSHSYVKTDKLDDRFIHQKTTEIDLKKI